MTEYERPALDTLTPSRQRIALAKDGYVRKGEALYRIAELIGFTSVVGIDLKTKKAEVLDIQDVRPLTPEAEQAAEIDLEDITDKDWQQATIRLRAIQPFLQRSVAGKAEMEARAQEVGVNAVTLYRWLSRYKARESITALIPRKRGWAEGKSRLSQLAESVIQDVIKAYYLTPQRVSADKAVDEVRSRCAARGIPLPSATAIRARLAQIPEDDYLRGRGQKEKARNKFRPVPGQHPGGAFPLDVVQSDHTKLDIIVVDEVRRQPIGRPFLTLTVCIYSRMITGYYLSMDDPSETSIGLCMAHSILPKTDWLRAHNIDAEWPVWGFPRTLQVDNGADYRSNMLQKSCDAHNITLEFCPVRLPQYKGAVERINLTINKELHSLPGTTFSNIKERAEYDAQKEARLTLAELEEWLLHWICKTYHVKAHRSLGMSPLSQWTLGTLGDGETNGSGLPPLPADGRTIVLDFMPFKKRKINDYGVEVDGLTYYADVLSSWIEMEHPTEGGKKFTFRRDPRDISSLWFFDPRLKQYFQIPLADQTQPAISLWELKRGNELLKQKGIHLKDASESQRMQAALERRGMVDKAQGRSSAARREQQRQKDHAKKRTPADPLKGRKAVLSEPAPALSALLDDDVQPFGDIA